MHQSGTPTIVTLYEYRAKTARLATLQTLLFALSFLALYRVWVFGIIGFIVGLLGICATRKPVTRKKKKWLTLYACCNVVLLLIEIAAIVLWFFIVGFGSDYSAWKYFVLIFGLISYVVLAFISFYAIQAAGEFKHEIEREHSTGLL